MYFDHQYFQIPGDKRNTVDCMHQDNFNKKGGNGWRKEVHGTKDQNVIHFINIFCCLFM